MKLALCAGMFVALCPLSAAADPYDVANYSQSALIGEAAEHAAALASGDESLVPDALFLISGLDYQRLVIGNKTAVYIVLRERKLDAAYHPLCEHNVDKFEKVGLVKAKNSLDRLTESQSQTIRELASRCRAGTLNPGFSVAAFEKALEVEGGADQRLALSDTVTTVARTLIGTYGLMRGVGGRGPTPESSRDSASASN